MDTEQESKLRKIYINIKPITLLFIDFSKVFYRIHRRKMKEIMTAYGIPE